MPASSRKRKPPERVLATANDLFGRHAIDAIGVDEISARSGVSKSTLYRHFPSKADLVAEYLRASHEERLAQWVEVLGRDDRSPRERILAMFDWLETWFAGRGFRGCRFINAAVQLTDRRHPAWSVPRTHKESVRGLLVDAARQAHAEDPELLADQLLLLVDGAVVRALLEDSPEPAARAKDLAARLLPPD